MPMSEASAAWVSVESKSTMFENTRDVMMELANMVPIVCKNGKLFLTMICTFGFWF